MYEVTALCAGIRSDRQPRTSHGHTPARFACFALSAVIECRLLRRHGSAPEGGLQGRAGSSGSGGAGVRANASSPAPTRVLRKRDPKGRSGAPVRRAKEESPDWGGPSNGRLDSSQGRHFALDSCIIATTTLQGHHAESRFEAALAMGAWMVV